MHSACVVVLQPIPPDHFCYHLVIVALMAPVAYEHTLAVYQQFHAVYIVHSSLIHRTSGIDGRERVNCHHTARIVVAKVAKRVGKGVAECFIDVGQRPTWFHDLMHRRVDFLLQILIKVQGLRLNGLSNVIKCRGVAFRVFLR